MSIVQQTQGSAYLILRQGGRWSDVFRLVPNQPLVMGRSSKNAIVIADERSSRRHAEVFCDSGIWKVRDLGSRNGTMVDGLPIQADHPLQSGQSIQVAGISMSFVDSLESVFQNDRTTSSPLSDEKSISQTQEIDHPPTIIDSKLPQAWMAKMAFEMARQDTWEQVCEMLLDSLLAELKIQAGGIVRIESGAKPNTPIRMAIICARERSGKSYRRVSDFLAKHVLNSRQSVLARNIQDDPVFGNQPSTSQASLAMTTQSVLCSPIGLIEMEGGTITSESMGLLHLYSRQDEPDLQRDALEIATSAAQLLSVAFQQLSQRKKIEVKLRVAQKQVVALKTQLVENRSDLELVGTSSAIVMLKNQLARVAATEATVLLRGESGVGKELAAREIHTKSSRSEGPFIAMNCGALSPHLLESELFGHEKGSFTGATERKAGKFELADGGTIFLDEVGEMSTEVQIRFLRALENRSFERVGGSKTITVDVRVIAATNKDLEVAVSEKTFRPDLYFRLRVVEIRLPSLRQRQEDIIPLAEHFLSTFRQRSSNGPTGFSQRAKQAMLAYAWPGNIRELKNCVERAHVLSNHILAEPEDLALSHLIIPGIAADKPEDTQTSRPNIHDVGYAEMGYVEKSLDAIEREHIEATLGHTQGQKSRAAAILGIERSTLDRKLRKYEE